MDNGLEEWVFDYYDRQGVWYLPHRETLVQGFVWKHRWRVNKGGDGSLMVFTEMLGSQLRHREWKFGSSRDGIPTAWAASSRLTSLIVPISVSLEIWSRASADLDNLVTISTLNNKGGPSSGLNKKIWYQFSGIIASLKVRRNKRNLHLFCVDNESLVHSNWKDNQNLDWLAGSSCASGLEDSLHQNLVPNPQQEGKTIPV